MRSTPIGICISVLFFSTVRLAPAGSTTCSSGQLDSIPPPGWFPERSLFPKLVADGTGQQLSVSKDLDSKRIVGSIGGLQRLVETTVADFPVQFGVGATVYGNFIRQPNVLDVVTIDFFVDLPIDIRFSERLALRTGWGHYSAHLADDGIEALGKHSINYAKDYVPLFAAYTIPAIGGFVYGGCRIDYFTIPERNAHFVLEGGVEFGNVRISSGLNLYGAIDVKSRQEISWATTQSFQAGVRFLIVGSHSMRIAYTYRTGADERGQFYSERLTSSLMGVFVDF